MAKISIWPNVEFAGATKLFEVVDWIGVSWRETIGNDRGAATMTLPIDSDAIAYCAIYNVLRIVDEDGTVYEYRITKLSDKLESPIATVTCEPIINDLGRNPIAVTLGGMPSFNIAESLLTPAQYIQNFMLPWLTSLGITHFALGDVTPTGKYSIAAKRITPLALGGQLETLTKYELQARRDTISQKFLLDLVRIGESATSPEARVGVNVQAMDRDITADQRFYTRAFPFGAVVGSEIDESHIGQHGWKVSAVTGLVATLAHPQAGGDGPLGADDQLNGTYASVSFNMIFPRITTGTQPKGYAYDPTRRTIWWSVFSYASAFDTLCWYDLRDNTSGTVSISGSTSFGEICYDGGTDELLVACSDASKIERITLSTKASAGNYACAAGPTTLTNLVPLGGTHLAIGFATGTHGIELMVMSTHAHAAYLDTLAANSQHCLFSSATNAFYTFSSTSTAVHRYDNTFAHIAAITPFASNVAALGADTANGVVYMVEAISNPHARSYNEAGATLGTSTALGSLNGGAITPVVLSGEMTIMPFIGGKLYFHENGTNRHALVVIDTAAAYAIAGYVHTPGECALYDSTDDVFVMMSTLGGIAIYYRNGNLLPSGRLRFAVADSAAGAQTVTAVGGTKGPIVAGQLMEFRDDAADTYRLHLDDPVNLALYGSVDGFPQFTDGYKRNYRDNPRFDLWVSNLPVFTGLVATGANASSIGQPRWVKADAQTVSRSTVAAIDGAQAKTADVVTTMNVKGLTPGRVIQCGDWVHSASAGGRHMSILDRAVADGSGKASVTCIVDTTATWADNEVITLWSPIQSDGLGDYMLVMPAHTFLGATFSRPSFTGGVHIPAIGGADRAWIRFRFLVQQFNADTAQLQVTFGGYDDSVLNPDSLVAGTEAAPAFTAFELDQPVDLSVVPAGTDAFLTWQQNFEAFTGVIYLQAIEVFVMTADAPMPTPVGAVTGDELIPWVGANQLLFDKGRSSPSIVYRVAVLEDAAKYVLGVTTKLFDPQRNIIGATPRCMEVTRIARRESTEIAAPQIVLDNNPDSILAAIVALENAQ
jgi:hypothetical protein